MIRLVCQFTPIAPGDLPWVLPSLCQMMMMSSALVLHPSRSFMGVAVPDAEALKLLVVPAGSPQGVNRRGYRRTRCARHRHCRWLRGAAPSACSWPVASSSGRGPFPVALVRRGRPTRLDPAPRRLRLGARLDRTAGLIRTSQLGPGRRLISRRGWRFGLALQESAAIGVFLTRGLHLASCLLVGHLVQDESRR